VKLLVVKRGVAIFAACALLLGIIAAIFAKPVADAVAAHTPAAEFTVVLDAGHGGKDPGVVGINSKVGEAVINLDICLRLEKILLRNGIAVVLTRTDKNSLIDDSQKGYKRLDMQARKQIIMNAKPSLVLSVHCNRFPDKTKRGAQAFYDKDDAAGERLAKTLQTNLNSELNQPLLNKSHGCLTGDFYMLNCSPYPSALVECGFMSNPDDDKLLNTEAHRQLIAETLAKGIISFLHNS
jgi:N-acetylmuramoyl-L-alanine amidase